MTTYTHDQIALMAKLVPDIQHDERGYFVETRDLVRSIAHKREWSPWSDWRDLGPLFLACYGWWDKHYAEVIGDPEIWFPLMDATNTSDFPAFAAAVCNLAIEIGRAHGVSEPTTCTWREDEDGNWDTDCGDCFVLISDGPSDNRMKFCCYCGKPITEIGFDEEGEESE